MLRKHLVVVVSLTISTAACSADETASSGLEEDMPGAAMTVYTDGPLSLDDSKVGFELAGCATRDSFSINFIPSKQASRTSLFIKFHEFSLVRNPEDPTDAQTAACNMTLPVSVAAGYQFAVKGIQFAGKAALSEGMGVLVGGSYWIDGQAIDLTLRHEMDGPSGILDPQGRSGNWTLIDEAQTDWTECGERATVSFGALMILSGLTGGSANVTFMEAGFGGSTREGVTVDLEVRRCSSSP